MTNLDPTGKKILDSFGPSHNQWRSIGGIERQSGLAHNEVQSYIENHSDLFIQSSISPSGSHLYKPNPKFATGW